MANLQYAKESILIKVISDVAENDKRTQSLELCGRSEERRIVLNGVGELAECPVTNVALRQIESREARVVPQRVRE